VFIYDAYAYIFEFHTCQNCKGNATGYCYFHEGTQDMLTDGKCEPSTANNRVQLLMSTPLCSLTQWQMNANTGDWMVVEATEMMPKQENWKNDVKIHDCKAKQ